MAGQKPFRTTRRLLNLREGRNDWYRIQAKASGAEVHIYDEIGYFGVTAQDFVRDLNAIKGPIEVHLNSPGGEVFDGFAIYNALKQRGDVSITIDGLAASIASVIAQAADKGKLRIGKHASMMIHDGFSQAIGNAQEMRELADQLDRQSDNIAGVYADRTGRSADYWRALMRKETWYSGQEAVDAGLADALVDGPAVKNVWDMSIFRNARNATDGGWTIQDGKVIFDPDGDGDDDSRPETDLDHGWWDENCGLIKPIPAMPPEIRKALADGTATYGDHDDDDDEHDDDDNVVMKPVKAKKLKKLLADGVDTSEWDAGKAWHNGAASDDPAAFYKAICAGRKAGDPDKQSSWALPYRYTPTSPPNAAGVRNALARLDQTNGLTNKEQARSLLQGLMEKINPDYEPANQVDPRLIAAVFTQALKGGQ